MRAAVDLPSPGDPARSQDSEERLDLFIVEAGASRERRCADCGNRTAEWKPVRRRGLSAVLCKACAAKAAAAILDRKECPSCGAVLHRADRFCGKCGAAIAHACPACAAVMDADDVFCGKCGARVG